eukprot:gnl/TRDRNA2_/TRDRNA2_166132_c0_seq1.p1 gnl/TRDRNA2_/TRDRNA2_166132_c0~~gnl/TRDRNA2_/TRDRNA2_166132_c0_seq1.p1  ORF type:complete len:410 (+),score=71.62 gnl/TRDRNA2_/TRDRNA2_166132_c0_seq1:100-1329(+)
MTMLLLVVNVLFFHLIVDATEQCASTDDAIDETSLLQMAGWRSYATSAEKSTPRNKPTRTKSTSHNKEHGAMRSTVKVTQQGTRNKKEHSQGHAKRLDEVSENKMKVGATRHLQAGHHAQLQKANVEVDSALSDGPSPAPPSQPGLLGVKLEGSNGPIRGDNSSPQLQLLPTLGPPVPAASGRLATFFSRNFAPLHPMVTNFVEMAKENLKNMIGSPKPDQRALVFDELVKLANERWKTFSGNAGKMARKMLVGSVSDWFNGVVAEFENKLDPEHRYVDHIAVSRDLMGADDPTWHRDDGQQRDDFLPYGVGGQVNPFRAGRSAAGANEEKSLAQIGNKVEADFGDNEQEESLEQTKPRGRAITSKRSRSSNKGSILSRGLKTSKMKSPMKAERESRKAKVKASPHRGR